MKRDMSTTAAIRCRTPIVAKPPSIRDSTVAHPMYENFRVMPVRARVKKDSSIVRCISRWVRENLS